MTTLEEAIEIKRVRHTRRHRDKIEMLRDVLKAASSGDLKTHLMYRANLSHPEINNIIGKLVKLGLLEKKLYDDDESNLVIFKTTDAGFSFLKAVSVIDGLLDFEES